MDIVLFLMHISIRMGFCVHNIAQTVSGTRKSNAGFLSCAGIKDLPAHVAGHKAIILVVEQQDRNVCVPHRLNGAGFLQIKMPEQSGAPNRMKGMTSTGGRCMSSRQTLRMMASSEE